VHTLRQVWAEQYVNVEGTLVWREVKAMPSPAEHSVDKGYTDSHILVDSRRDYDVTIVGPVADDPSWQARAGQGFDKT